MMKTKEQALQDVADYLDEVGEGIARREAEAAERAAQKGDTRPGIARFVEAALRHGSHEGPALLFDWFYSRKLTLEDLTEAAPYVWSGAHLPFAALGANGWVELFRLAGYSVDGVKAQRPVEPKLLYRAAEPRFVHRLAWTGTLDVAVRFLTINRARYGEKPRHVYSITVEPDRLFAHITDRAEDEYVADTRGLKATRVNLDGRAVTVGLDTTP